MSAVKLLPVVQFHRQFRASGGWVYEIAFGPFETREDARAAMERAMEQIRHPIPTDPAPVRSDRQRTEP